MFLSEDSILRNIPVGVEPRQALLLEALAFNMDVSEIAYSTLHKIATEQGYEFEEVGTHVRTQMFMHAWSFVDAIHNIRVIVGLLGPVTGVASEFMTIAESASRLRNCMDHIKDQVGNLARKKKSEPPLFGALNYNFVPEKELTVTSAGEIGRIERGYSVSVSVGRIPRKTRITAMAPLRNLIGEVADIRLEAFGYSLEMTDLYVLFSEFVKYSDRTISVNVSSAVKKMCEENGVSLEEHMKTSPQGFSSVIEWTGRHKE